MDERSRWDRKTGLIPRPRGQSLLEFALAAPILFLLMFGVFELGRIVFLFSTLNNASREAVRYGAATGTTVGNNPRYLACDQIKQAAIDAAFLSGLEADDIQVGYERPAGNTFAGFGPCGDDDADDAGDIQVGDRIVVTITRPIEPILTILPAPQFNPSFVTARTVLKDIVIGPVACSDGKDNDGDGLYDYPDDDGCTGPNDTTEAICYRLSVVGQPLEGGNLSTKPSSNCSNRFIETTFITVTADAAPAYTFENWSGDISSTDEATDFTINSDMNVIANFRLLEADLGLSKLSSVGTIGVGEPFQYDLMVTNPMTDDATAVVLTDTLPSGVTWTGWGNATASNNCAQSSGLITCTLGLLPYGGTANFLFDVTAPPAPMSGTITNTAGVRAFEHDPNPGNNTALATTEVIPLADMSVDASDSPDPVDAGSALDYTITITNGGPSLATGVTVVNTFSRPVALNLTGVGCVQDPNPGTTITCTFPDLASGATDTITFSVTAPQDGGPLTNDVEVSAIETDRDTSNNSDSEDTNVLAADLGIVKSGGGDWVRDQQYSYLIAVTNFGPSTAASVVVTDTLPSGIDYSQGSISSSVGTCSLDGANVECQLGNMADGVTEQITIDVTPTIDEGTIINTAGVRSNRSEGTNSNSNTDSETATVYTDVQLSLTKSTSAFIVNLGDTFTYVLTVENNGQSDAKNVQIKDTLPVSVTYSSSTGCSHSGGVVTCDVGTIGPQASQTYDIVVTAVATGTVTNTATLTSDDSGTIKYTSAATEIVDSPAALTPRPNLVGRMAWRGDSFRRW